MNAEVSASARPPRRALGHAARRLPADEIRFLAAHELAHVQRRHVWKGLGWLALLAPPSSAIAVAAAPLAVDPSQVPKAVLSCVLLRRSRAPLTNAVSRRYEAEADHLGLEATRNPAADAAFSPLRPSQPPRPVAAGWWRSCSATHPTRRATGWPRC